MTSYTKEQFLNLNKIFNQRSIEKHRDGGNYFLRTKSVFKKRASNKTIIRNIKQTIFSELLKHPKCKETINMDSFEILDVGKGLKVQFNLTNGKIHGTSARFSPWAENDSQLQLALIFDLLISLYYEVFNDDYLNYLA